MNNPIRILHVVTKMDRAGLETMLMNYYRHIDKNKVEFDFLTHREEEGAYDAEILALGGRIYHVTPIAPRHFGAYLKQLDAFFARHHEYHIVHAHLDALSYFALHAAQKAGIPNRIAHSHVIQFNTDWKLPLRLAARPLILNTATDLWGCSRNAVRFMFGRTVHLDAKVVPNAIDPSRFAFCSERREETREALGVSGRFVVGHVGRLVHEKNHKFLLRVFKQINLMDRQTVLILAGAGPLETSLRRQANDLKLGDSVLFVGQTEDVSSLLQAFDVFVMPSLHEGLGIAGIEAQASGLPIVFSDNIPIEAKLSENVTFLSLCASPLFWARVILAQKGQPRLNNSEMIAQGGYSIYSAAQALEKDYIDMYMETLK